MLGMLLDSAARSLGLGLFLYLALRLLGQRSPHVEITIWTAFLAGAVVMPLLVDFSPLSLPRPPIPWANVALAQPPASMIAEDSATAPAAPTKAMDAAAAETTSPAPVDGIAVATDIYLAVATGLLLRIAIGLALMQRKRSRARPVREQWVGNCDVRVSAVVAAPVTFGRTILLPHESGEWSAAKRRAVLAHEGAHVAAGDFYIQLLAVLHRAIFWFSPLSWWLLSRLATLAETISDNAAIDCLGDRASYAAILLDVASRARRPAFGVAMARCSRVSQRLDAILTETKMHPVLTWRKKALLALALTPALAVAASAVAQNAAPVAAAQGETPQIGEQMKPVDPSKFEPYLGAFQLDPLIEPDTAVTLTRQGDRFFAQTTGGKPAEVFVDKDGGFVFQGRHSRLRNDVIADGKVAAFEFLWRDRYLKAQRIDDSEAKRIADLHAERLAEQAAPRKVVAFDPKLFDAYVGYYQFSDQKVFTVTREGDRFFTQTTGQSKHEKFPESDHKFFSTISAAQMSFERDSDGRAGALVLHQYGWERRAPKITEAEADKINDAYAQRLAQEVHPHNLVVVDPKLFDGYVGKYQLGPRTIMTATREGDRLFMQLTGQEKFELFPASAREYFYTIVAAQISFETDDQGRATKLVLHQNGWDQTAERLD
jgi:beta-lactamase regulating signal transducer with metallopeptidase domain